MSTASARGRTAGLASVADQELKQKDKAMWATGDYPVMVETFLLPLGPRITSRRQLKELQLS